MRREGSISKKRRDSVNTTSSDEKLSVSDITEIKIPDQKSKYMSLNDQETQYKTLDEESAQEILGIVNNEDELDLEEEITEENLQNFIERLFSENCSDKIELVNTLISWIKDNPSNRAELVEEKLGKYLTTEEAEDVQFNLPVVKLLGEVSQTRDGMLVKDDLSFVLERQDMDYLSGSDTGEKNFFTDEIKDQLNIMTRMNNKGVNMELHKILDFFQDHYMAVQNHVEDEITKQRNQTAYQGGFSSDIEEFVNDAISNADNYLIKKHLEDINNMRERYLEIAPGSSLGNKDSEVFISNRLKETYRLMVENELHEGQLLRNPVFEIAPGYLAKYQDGNLDKIYKKNEEPEEEKKDNYVDSNPDLDGVVYEIYMKT
ncbi:MAG: hypothetical protein BRC22_00660 [Parcubacteria group bacterium QH_9_35_7]|nr:MAG: hypothetical protein BRC22_00660 [Parcubacteria group bacterium QH_9_35_7]